MDFLKTNARVFLIALLAIGLVLVFAFAGDDGDDDASEEVTSSETVEAENSEETTESTDTAAPTESVVDRSEAGVSTISAVSGDNQTVMVRKVIASYLSGSGTALSPEQMLHAETNLVNELPRNDLIFTGDTVRLTDEQVKTVVDQSLNLSDTQITAWGAYL